MESKKNLSQTNESATQILTLDGPWPNESEREEFLKVFEKRLRGFVIEHCRDKSLEWQVDFLGRFIKDGWDTLFNKQSELKKVRLAGLKVENLEKHMDAMFFLDEQREVFSRVTNDLLKVIEQRLAGM